MADPDVLPSIEELTAAPVGVETGGGRPGVDGSLRRTYTEDDKDRALMAILRCGGDHKRAAVLLGMKESTLYYWKSKGCADRYHELRVRFGPELEAHRIGEIQELADLYVQAERDVVIRLRDNVDDLDLRDLAKAAQMLAVAKDKNIRDYLTLQGRPVQVTEQRSPDKALEELERLGVIELEAVEVSDVAD